MLLKLQKNGVLNIKVDPSEEKNKVPIKIIIEDKEGILRFRDRRLKHLKNTVIINTDYDYESRRFKKEERIYTIPASLLRKLEDLGIDKDRRVFAASFMAALNHEDPTRFLKNLEENIKEFNAKLKS